MGNPLTEAREAVAEVLGTLGVVTYGAPPENITLPAVIVAAGDPWSMQMTFGSVRVQFNLTLAATMQGKNIAAMANLEQLAWDVRAAIEGVVGVTSGPTTPVVRQFGSTEAATCDIVVQVLVTTEETS